MRVIGTAGHVDHGKSALVEALTGTHPDRLKEEQEREMTIDLGFAWLKLPDWARLPDADEIGIVDVPGHRDFIDNMLAGVGGIDGALFVVAADEGIMPQSREHLAILDLLQVQAGVLALTKIDLVSDSEWLDLVEEDARKLLVGTALSGASAVRVSAHTGAGLDDLVREISAALARRPPRPDLSRPRLPVDRVFTIAGFGTVLTGTLGDGQLMVGEEVEILPSGLRGRIRGIQSHQRSSRTAEPGSRTAVNVSGLDKDQVHRGDVLAHPGDYRPSRRIDVEFRSLPDAASPVKHDMEVKLFIGAAEVSGRVRVIEKDVLRPGETGWLQIEVEDPVIAARGDRYILRRPSPGATLGGGSVLDPHPPGRHRRFSGQVLLRMEALSRGTPREVLLESISASGPVSVRTLADVSGLGRSALELELQTALSRREVAALGAGSDRVTADTLVMAANQWEALRAGALREVQAYHLNYPLRKGMVKEELRSRLKLSLQVFNAALARLLVEGVLEERGLSLAFPGHHIQFTPGQERSIEVVMQRFVENPSSPPTVREVVAAVGEDVYAALVDLDVLVPVSAEIAFRREDYDRMVDGLQRDLEEAGTMSVAEFRDRYGTSRRYALAFLEHLDERGITVREGDIRRLVLPGVNNPQE
ncbi:MAG TPA: selenocysteine-specific translation elongation factor [Anaerolineales bacterium]|nr:selenocysteine-specific translation elongation factor [Anaerolineales bacterium]